MILQGSSKMHWQITDKGDADARALADRHYTRQTPGAVMFTRNGQNLVFITEDLRAVWVSFRPTPNIAVRPDGLEAIECALFRNEGLSLSSALIREATLLTWALWGPFPRDGLITFVRPECVASAIPGYCFKRAGWRRVGYSSDGKPMLRAPRPSRVPPLSDWQWHLGRGGKLRREFESGERA